MPFRMAGQTSLSHSASVASKKATFDEDGAAAFCISNAARCSAALRSKSQRVSAYQEFRAARARHVGTSKGGVGVSRIASIFSPLLVNAVNVWRFPSRHAANVTAKREEGFRTP